MYSLKNEKTVNLKSLNLKPYCFMKQQLQRITNSKMLSFYFLLKIDQIYYDFIRMLFFSILMI